MASPSPAQVCRLRVVNRAMFEFDEPDAVVAVAEFSDLAGELRHFSHAIELVEANGIERCRTSRSCRDTTPRSQRAARRCVIAEGSLGRLSPIRHPLDDAPMLAAARHSRQKLARARHVRLCRGTRCVLRVASAYATMPAGPNADTISIRNAKTSGNPNPMSRTLNCPRESHANSSATGSGAREPPPSRSLLHSLTQHCLRVSRASPLPLQSHALRAGLPLLGMLPWSIDPCLRAIR